ncbi:hypothetical protein D3C78_1561880 [compost metagenome]
MAPSPIISTGMVVSRLMPTDLTPASWLMDWINGPMAAMAGRRLSDSSRMASSSRTPAGLVC